MIIPVHGDLGVHDIYDTSCNHDILCDPKPELFNEQIYPQDEESLLFEIHDDEYV